MAGTKLKPCLGHIRAIYTISILPELKYEMVKFFAELSFRASRKLLYYMKLLRPQQGHVVAIQGLSCQAISGLFLLPGGGNLIPLVMFHMIIACMYFHSCGVTIITFYKRHKECPMIFCIKCKSTCPFSFIMKGHIENLI